MLSGVFTVWVSPMKIYKLTLLVAVAVFCTVLSGCSPLASPSSFDVPKSSSKEDMCRVLQAKVIGEIFGGEPTSPSDDSGQAVIDGISVCSFVTSSEDAGFVKLSVNTGEVAIGEIIAINEGVIRNDDSSCLPGSKLLDLTAGAKTETSVICKKDDQTLLTYDGVFASGALGFRVSRPLSYAEITEAEAQSWLTDVSPSRWRAFRT